MRIKSGIETLHGWHAYADNASPKFTVVQFHGNAANISNHWALLEWAPRSGFDAIAFDYSGYGNSTGKSSLASMKRDCVTVIEYLRSEHQIRSPQLIILGQSLGGFLFCRIYRELELSKISAVIFDSTFIDLERLVRQKIPSFVPKSLISFAAGQLFDQNERPDITDLRVPGIVIHSLLDPVVPFLFGRKLYETLPGSKSLITLDSPDHLAALRSGSAIIPDLLRTLDVMTGL